MTPARIAELRFAYTGAPEWAAWDEMLDEIERLRGLVRAAHLVEFGYLGHDWRIHSAGCTCGAVLGHYEDSLATTKALHAAHIEAILNGGAS